MFIKRKEITDLVCCFEWGRFTGIDRQTLVGEFGINEGAALVEFPV